MYATNFDVQYAKQEQKIPSKVPETTSFNVSSANARVFRARSRRVRSKGPIMYNGMKNILHLFQFIVVT